jgi:predicted negative regulator of RcsB-dependent stress response
MNSTAVLMVVLVILPAAGLVAWAWFAMAQAEDELRAFSELQGLHLET